MHLNRTVIPFIALGVFAACSHDSTDPGQVATTITAEIDTVDYGTTVSPNIVVKDQRGNPITGSLSGHLTIESSDTSVATADADAMTITGTGIGEATFTVRYDDIEVDATVPVRLGPAPAKRLIAGAYHSCVLSTVGAASCWGMDTDGELGDGSNLDSGSPVAVHGGHLFSTIAAGYYHNCGLENGAAWCWGFGGAGVLGNGADTTASEPVPVVGGHTFAQITAGDAISCGLTDDGTAYCWGANYGGSLGIGSTDAADSSYVPVQVTGGVKFARITADGYRVCALTRLGKAYCWGTGWGGALGTGNEDSQPSPVAVLDSITFVSLVGGYDHSCGIDREGRAFCWGYNGDGEAGNNTTAYPVFAPVQAQTSARFSILSEGQYDHLCGIDRSDATLLCWGWNGVGQIGDGTTNDAHVPTVVPSLHATEVAAGDSHSCAISVDDNVYCWGSNVYGSVGDGTVGGPDVYSPSRVVGLSAVLASRTARSMTTRMPTVNRVDVRSSRGSRNPLNRH